MCLGRRRQRYYWSAPGFAGADTAAILVGEAKDEVRTTVARVGHWSGYEAFVNLPSKSRNPSSPLLPG